MQQVRNIAVCVEFTLPRQIYFVIVVEENIVQKKEIDGSNPPLKYTLYLTLHHDTLWICRHCNKTRSKGSIKRNKGKQKLFKIYF